MKMIWDKCPCIALGLSIIKDHSESIQKGSAILIVPKDFPAFDSLGHYMLQDTGGIKSGLTWHVLIALYYHQIWRFVQMFSAISLVIPACLQIELNVPFGILLLFRGTITTLFFSVTCKCRTLLSNCIV